MNESTWVKEDDGRGRKGSGNLSWVKGHFYKTGLHILCHNYEKKCIFANRTNKETHASICTRRRTGDTTKTLDKQ